MFWLTTRQLKNGSLNARKKAAKELWREANPRALEPLTIALASDPNAEIRQLAASALGRLHVPGRIDPLVQALKDKDAEVIKSALLALRRAREDRIIDSLVPLLQHPDFGVRTHAGQTIDTIRWVPADKSQ